MGYQGDVPSSPRPYALYKGEKLFLAARARLATLEEATRKVVSKKVKDELGLTPLYKKQDQLQEKLTALRTEIRAAGGERMDRHGYTKADKLVEARMKTQPYVQKGAELQAAYTKFQDTVVLADRKELARALEELEKALR
jgi:chaperonin cofactor prefoldin